MRLLEPEIEPLMRFITGKVMSTDDAEDLFQDSILIAYENFGKLKSRAAFSGWLRSCARTAISRKFRKKASREQPMEISDQTDETQILNGAPAEDLESSVIRKLDHERLTQLVAKLSFTERSFLSLRYGQECPTGT